jgi:hypothetical protein
VRHVRLTLCWLLFIGSIVLWVGYEAAWWAQSEPPFTFRLSILAISWEAFNGIGINSKDE